MLVALILAFGPISGAHINPAVTLARLPKRAALARSAGVPAAHLMFGQPVFSASRHARVGPHKFFSGFVATFGLLCVIAAGTLPPRSG